MIDIKVKRRITIPDKIAVERFRRVPDLGPSLLFFSGGSALAPLARRLIDFTHNSIHLITPFDSGGSSAELRKAFRMPAVGDVRNRLMALADQSVHGNRDVFNLFAHRLPHDDPEEAANEFEQLRSGRSPLISIITDPLRKIIRNHLRLFDEAVPKEFNFAGASVGNLILTGGYLNSERHLDPVIYLFSKLVEARGIVRPVVNRYADLLAESENGALIIGQKKITDRQAGAGISPLGRIGLVEGEDNLLPVATSIRGKNVELIQNADLILYPMGSFFTSLLASLLPKGIGSAIARNVGLKIFIPNTGTDPESVGISLNRQVEILLEHLKRTAAIDTPASALLNFILVDTKRGGYEGSFDPGALAETGIQTIDTELISDKSAPFIDEELLIPVLLSLV